MANDVQNVLDEIKKAIQNPLVVQWAQMIQNFMSQKTPNLENFFKSMMTGTSASGSSVNNPLNPLNAMSLNNQPQTQNQANLQAGVKPAQSATPTNQPVNPLLAFFMKKFLEEMATLEKNAELEEAQNPTDKPKHVLDPEAVMSELERELMELDPDYFGSVGKEDIENEVAQLKSLERGSPTGQNNSVANKFMNMLSNNQSFSFIANMVQGPATPIVSKVATLAVTMAKSVFTQLTMESPQSTYKTPTPYDSLKSLRMLPPGGTGGGSK